MTKYVYSFLEGGKEMKELLGGKGANLSEMTKIGLPVPSGFIISTQACNRYFDDGYSLNSTIQNQIEKAITNLEKQVAKSFGQSPCLLVSVRSGSVHSMPGMMDTILNLGLNDQNVIILAESSNSMRFAFDSYRRFIQMYGNVVLNIPANYFEDILEEYKKKNQLISDKDLEEGHLRNIIKDYKKVVLDRTGKEFEQSPKLQLYAAIEAVFKSWNNERAKIYRQLNNIPDDVGTAVNIQMMVFGNMGDTSGTGVVFTRNPSTGENVLFGEFLMNAQGEDVVAGLRTPLTINHLKNTNAHVYQQLLTSSTLLEKHYLDMQDIEFTIEKGVFYLLQTRNGKRSATAAVQIAVDFVKEGLIEKTDAVNSLDLAQIDKLLHPEFDQVQLSLSKELAVGLPASPGAVSGQVYFDSESAENAKEKSKYVILVRVETSPEDIQGMISSDGVLTARGGMTSHAAVVARGMGKSCITGCADIIIDKKRKTMRVGECQIKEGDYISINGSTGKVYLGEIETRTVNFSDNFIELMKWADASSEMQVLANADTPADALKAREFGAKGIGLCRTEHMFFKESRISDMRRMILSKDTYERKEALANLYSYQKEDFKQIFIAMESSPVNIRLLDPPLHEFLPKGEDEMTYLAEKLHTTYEDIRKTTEELNEVNPMMGLRGCRLGIIYPEIYEMQVRAIISAALEVKSELNLQPTPEIMIPLVGYENELSKLRSLIKAIIERLDPSGELGDIKIGTMIEVPRACVVADRIAKHADYFSFGTNDLTQMTLGFSRDDAGTIISKYKEQKILETDPFQKIDENGVGELIKIAIQKGKQLAPNLKLGVCGEHAGEVDSIHFLNTLGLDYISCSPYRVPKARLASAQAALKQKKYATNLNAKLKAGFCESYTK